MDQRTLFACLLDSMPDPVVFVDTGHVIRYMNRAAVAHHQEGTALIGRSVLDCHNERSRQTIVAITAEMLADGLQERLITDTRERRIFMRAVRDDRGALLGYFERYEPPRQAAGTPPGAAESC